ncbi:hypothetical protein [Croceicoccus naphthovorans]|uniref:Inner membrane protein n=1 Tax=Croceicoccus naphthovorans TaxID=1348774 RepID=A0A0G3XMW1_9SPHN|nr:hypothetical protein [Croceicoccus naphthovorans]AKM11994.1 inner membrane protein [Croceicoccus naphthovorans]EZP69609.1 putative inner membrane protein [Sphingomonas paucimobilis]MBB3991781.1 hypothetical protein [Croceicoccus naphthovorans]
MRHPLLAFLLTPMAAPETPRLRRLRWALVLLCMGLAIAAHLNTASVALFGPVGALPALLLLAAAAITGVVYFRAKARADESHNRGEEP